MSSHSAFSAVPYEKLEDKKPIILPTPTNDQHRLILASQRLQKRERQRRRGCCTMMSSTLTAFVTIGLIALLLIISRRFQLPKFSWNREASSEREYSTFVHRPPVVEFPQRKTQFKRPPVPAGREDRLNCSGERADDIERTQFGVDMDIAKSLDGLVDNSQRAHNVEFQNNSVMYHAAEAYRQCLQTDESHLNAYWSDVKDTIHRKFGFDAASTRSSEDLLRQLFERDRLPRLVGSLQNAFGIDTLFELSVAANYRSPDGEQPFMLYLDHKRSNPSARQAERLQIEMDQVAMASEDSSNWEEISVAEATERWPFFDFKVYFHSLTMDSPQLRSVMADDDFRFVVKCPACLDRWDAVVETEYSMPTREVHEHLATHINAQFQLDKSPYLRNVAKHPLCASHIRTYLPHVAGKLYTELYSTEETKMQAQTALMAKKILINHLLTDAKDIKNEEIRSLTEEKLRKIGFSFGAPDWLKNRRQFEMEHRSLEITANKNYYYSQMSLKRFALEQNLHRVINRNEALRSSAFDLTSTADVKVQYSRIGNWLYIPAAAMRVPDEIEAAIRGRTAPLRSHQSPEAEASLYASLGWYMGREIAKAIDEEGFRWSVYGVHSYKSDEMDRPINILRETINAWSREPSLNVTDDLICNIVGLDTAFRGYTGDIAHLIRPLKSRRQSPQNEIERVFQQTFHSILCTEQRSGETNLKPVEDYLKAMLESRRKSNGNFGFPSDRLASSKSRVHFN